jgi:hypothetical protein
MKKPTLARRALIISTRTRQVDGFLFSEGERQMSLTHRQQPVLRSAAIPALTASRIGNVEREGTELVEPFRFSGSSHCYRERAKGDFQCIACIGAPD